MKPANLGHMLA